jgi:hypothetical protein
VVEPLMNTRAGAADTTARPDSLTRVLPRRPVKTYIHYGREVYADTGRPVDERLGSHVVLWIVEDAQAWAAQIEADADAAVAKYPRCRIARQHRERDYESAAQVRAAGAYRSWRNHHHSLQDAQDEVASLYRGCRNAGVRYEVAEITDAAACPDCHRPTVCADGQWRHHIGGYPAECPACRDPTPDRAARRNRCGCSSHPWRRHLVMP